MRDVGEGNDRYEWKVEGGGYGPWRLWFGGRAWGLFVRALILLADTSTPTCFCPFRHVVSGLSPLSCLCVLDSFLSSYVQSRYTLPNPSKQICKFLRRATKDHQIIGGKWCSFSPYAYLFLSIKISISYAFEEKICVKIVTLLYN